jgi:hypothetical protein
VKREVHFEQMAQEATLLDYLHEVEHAAARIARLDGAIAEAVKLAPPKMRAVIAALQALRGIAHVAAVTVVAELARAKQLMGYGGIVASEHSKLRGPTDTDRPWEPACASGKNKSAKRSKRSPGKHNSGYINAIGSCWPTARTRA